MDHSKRRGLRVSPGLVVVVLLVLLPVIVIVYASTRSDSDQSYQAETTTSEATTTATAPTATTGAPAPNSDTTPVTRQAPDACQTASEIETRVGCFVAAWYELRPDDTTESRVERVSPYASDLFMSQHGHHLEVYTDTQADIARIDSDITQSASVGREIIVAPDDSHPGLAQVVTTASLMETTGDSSPEFSLTAYLDMTWSNSGGTWQIENIVERAG